MTGTTSNTIQAGLLPDLRNASTTFSRLMALARACSEVVLENCAFNSALKASRSISSSRVLSASAPILAAKRSSNFSRLSWYSSSVNVSIFLRSVSPGSMTM